MKRAVFLDRDGTIIFDGGYLRDPDGIELLPGAADALKRLQEADFLLVIISNQSAIGRGMCLESDVEAVNDRMCEVFEEFGVRFDAIVYCPHSPEDRCDCRKPEPKMILDVAKRLNIDLEISTMVGDKMSDVNAGVAAGCGTNVLLSVDKPDGHTIVAPDMADAVKMILKQP